MIKLQCDEIKAARNNFAHCELCDLINIVNLYYIVIMLCSYCLLLHRFFFHVNYTIKRVMLQCKWDTDV